MKLISWNVNGLRAAVTKGFIDSFNELDADIFCLQETKLQPHQIELELPGYEQFWNSAVKKGYSGTAVFTRIKPIAVTNGIGIEEHDFNVKFKNAVRFLEDGDKVKVTIMFRGRELSHPELGEVLLNKMAAQLKEMAVVERQPKLEGKNMIMIVAPKPSK